MANKNDSSVKNFRHTAGLNTKAGGTTSIQLAEVMDNIDYARLGRLRVFIQGSQSDKQDPNNCTDPLNDPQLQLDRRRW